ncbi:hypothetical protein CIK05_13150 [Bdellovibrio sp. qaytius]|nr:hypothetical protein CIK05_13150 [Bdellovibrio sp. qaytius]
MSLLLCQLAWAQSSENQGMVFEGTLTDTSGNEIDLQSQQLYFYVSAFDASARKCILFAESSAVAGDSSGNILHRYGSGNAVVSPVSYNNTISNSIFNGIGSGKLADGSGTSCTVAAASTRYVDVYSAVLNVEGSIVLGSTPYSQFANTASSLNGKADTDFILATSVSGGTTGQVLSRSGSSGFTWMTLPIAAGVTSIDLGSASATGTVSSARLADVITAGTYTKVTVDSKGRVISSGTLATTDIATGTLPIARGGTGLSTLGGANLLLGVNNAGTALEYKAMAGGSGVSVTVGSGAVNVDLNLSSSHVTTALGYHPANLAGDQFTGNTAFLSSVSVGHGTPMTRLDVSGTIKVGNGGETCTTVYMGAFRYNSGAMEFCNGTAWQALAVSGVASIANDSVTSAKILDGTIVAADIASSTITYGKLNIVDNDIPLTKVASLTTTLSALTTSISGKEGAVSAGISSQYYRGDKTWQTLSTTAVSEGTNLYYTDTRVRAASLAGYVSGSDTTIVAADTVLQAFSKIQGQINARWQTSNSDLYFNTGNVAIGSNTFPGGKLFVKQSGATISGYPVANFENWEDGSYAGTTPGVNITRRLPAGSSATAGFGSSINFQAEDSAKTVTGQAQISAQWINASPGTTYSSISLLTKDTSGSASIKLYMDQNNVIIPATNLQVAGSVRMGGDGGNTTQTCLSIESGKQRYNSTYKAMEFCDGANWRGINGVTYCDSGYTMIGTPGTASAFCMDTNVGSPQSYVNASNTCLNRLTSSGSKARLCTTTQMDLACESYNSISPTLVNFNNGIFHWTPNSIPVAGNTNYPMNMYVAYSSSNPATCHIEPNTGGSPYNGRQSNSDYINNSKNFRCCYE